MTDEQDEEQADLDHVQALLEYLADVEALRHLSDAEIEALLVSLAAAETKAGSWLEGNEVLLGTIQRGQELLQKLREFRARFGKYPDDFFGQAGIMEGDFSDMFGRQDPTTQEPAPPTPAEELAELEAEHRQLEEARKAAVSASWQLQTAPPKDVLRLAIGDPMQRSQYAAIVGEAEAAVKATTEAAEASLVRLNEQRACLAVSAAARRFAGEGPLARSEREWQERRLAALRRDLAALGVGGGSR
jgi:hypothetical protein